MWSIGDVNIHSHLLLGTARFPSPQSLQQSIERSGAEVITVSLRRESAAHVRDGQRFGITSRT